MWGDNSAFLTGEADIPMFPLETETQAMKQLTQLSTPLPTPRPPRYNPCGLLRTFVPKKAAPGPPAASQRPSGTQWDTLGRESRIFPKFGDLQSWQPRQMGHPGTKWDTNGNILSRRSHTGVSPWHVHARPSQPRRSLPVKPGGTQWNTSRRHAKDFDPPFQPPTPIPPQPRHPIP